MCEPTTIMAATMFATSAASQYQQYQAAGAQAEQQTKLYEQNRTNSYKALAQEYGDIGARQSQEQAASAERKEEIARQERAERASAIVRAGEAGVSGNSVALGLGDISGAAARDRSTVTRNLEWTMGQLQRSKASAQTSTINRINSMQTGSAPSKSALGLGILNSGASSYMAYESSKPKD
jgi:hypothetical protein